jgi:hypothetical protein
MLEDAALLLGPLKDEMVFIGGCATSLLITDPAANPIRATIDVDVLVEVSSLVTYHALSEKLRSQGFREDTRPEAPICRWTQKRTVLDVMPTTSDILGFGNQWYSPAFAASNLVNLPSGIEIRILPAPYFLATKFEAFDGRGEGDYLLSKDMEDIISVLDGRPEIIEEVRRTETSLNHYLNDRLARLLKNRKFNEALPGYLPSDPANQARAGLIISRMKKIIKNKKFR